MWEAREATKQGSVPRDPPSMTKLTTVNFQTKKLNAKRSLPDELDILDSFTLTDHGKSFSPAHVIMY